MKKKFKIIISLFAFIFLLGIGFTFMPNFVGSASVSGEATSAESNWKDRNIVYERVEKFIDISDEKVLTVTEELTVKYKESGINVGLARNISKVNKITRIVDGKKYVNTTYNRLEFEGCLIKGKGETEFKEEVAWLEEEGDYYYILIGEDYNFKSAGTYVYQIKYTYDMGEDFIKEFDDFTFDILDYDFGSPVLYFGATITLPKEFLKPEQNIEDILTFRTNKMQAIGYEPLNVNFDQANNQITCYYDNQQAPLSAGRGFTMQLILDQGYFNTSYTPNFVYYLIAVSLVLSILAIIICFLISRKGQKPVITPEFYPPKGYSPLDVARVYRGEIRDKDLASLVIYWTSVGLIKLEPKANKKYFIIKKLKNYGDVDLAGGAEPDSDRKEKAYFDALFDKSDTFDTEYMSSRLNSKLSKAISKLYEHSDDGKRKQKVLKATIHFFSTLPFLLLIIWNIMFDTTNFFLFFLFLFPFIGMMVFVYMRLPWFMLWFKLVWCGGFAGVPLILLVTQFLNSTYDIWNLVYFVVAIFLFGNYFTRVIKVRPQADIKVLGRVLGFRQFLLKAEKDKLERLICDDPEYYYHILPFCYALGITKVMEKKFASLRVEPPVYCEGISTTILYTHIYHSFSSSTSSFSSSGGGFGGGGGGSGGSSGGGGGGGGCHGR